MLNDLEKHYLPIWLSTITSYRQWLAIHWQTDDRLLYKMWHQAAQFISKKCAVLHKTSSKTITCTRLCPKQRTLEDVGHKASSERIAHKPNPQGDAQSNNMPYTHLPLSHAFQDT
ncbi:unnamed protein product [Prunus armeniaca]